MKKIRSLYLVINGNRGVTATIVVILMVVFLGFAALVIDLGYAYITKNELQNIADASALAATRQLGEIYLSLTDTEQKTYVCSSEDATLIKKAAQDVGNQNKAAAEKIDVLSEDIKIGTWNKKQVANPFLENNLQPHAVKVTARRDKIANNPISTFFANILGHDTIGLSADAIAALSGQSTIDEGEILPLGISSEWFKPTFNCLQPISFHPSNSSVSCGGWNSYSNSKDSNDNDIRKKIIGGMLKNTFTPPSASVGDKFYFVGGNLSNQTFEAFDALREYMRFHDGDGDDAVWTASVVVYDPSVLSDPCGNPNTGLVIEGFAKIRIQGVDIPNKEIIADVDCNLYSPGRGGGSYFGTFGSIPGLVE